MVNEEAINKFNNGLLTHLLEGFICITFIITLHLNLMIIVSLVINQTIAKFYKLTFLRTHLLEVCLSSTKNTQPCAPLPSRR